MDLARLWRITEQVQLSEQSVTQLVGFVVFKSVYQGLIPWLSARCDTFINARNSEVVDLARVMVKHLKRSIV